MRGCKRCERPGLVKRGVHFVVSDAKTGECLAAYDVCQECMEHHSPLIIPQAVVGALVQRQVRISYSSFGNKPDSI